MAYAESLVRTYNLTTLYQWNLDNSRGTLAAVRSIDKIIENISRLELSISNDAVGKEAIWAINKRLGRRGSDLVALGDYLVLVSEDMLKARADLEIEKPTKKSTGPAPRVDAQHVARRLAELFTKLTGKPPGRSGWTGDEEGRFYDLLAAAFEAIGIDAKPESYIKDAVRTEKLRFKNCNSSA